MAKLKQSQRLQKQQSSTRELDVTKRAEDSTSEQYIIRKINRTILELNERQKSRIEIAGNLYSGQIRFIRKMFGLIPHSCIPLSDNGYYRCFFWIKKDTPIANVVKE